MCEKSRSTPKKSTTASNGRRKSTGFPLRGLALFLHLHWGVVASLGVHMNGRFLISIAVVTLLALTVAGNPASQNAPTPLSQFKDAIRDYTKLHRRLERQLPPLRAASDAATIFESSDALASALRTARARAREGDIFTPEVSALLRTRIREALEARGYLPDELIAANLEEADDDAPLPAVNGPFPWLRGAAMWPSVIEALPWLPEELQYRIVGRDLVLVDVHANLVVDILREALR